MNINFKLEINNFKKSKILKKISNSQYSVKDINKFLKEKKKKLKIYTLIKENFLKLIKNNKI